MQAEHRPPGGRLQRHPHRVAALREQPGVPRARAAAQHAAPRVGRARRARALREGPPDADDLDGGDVSAVGRHVDGDPGHPRGPGTGRRPGGPGAGGPRAVERAPIELGVDDHAHRAVRIEPPLRDPGHVVGLHRRHGPDEGPGPGGVSGPGQPERVVGRHAFGGLAGEPQVGEQALARADHLGPGQAAGVGLVEHGPGLGEGLRRAATQEGQRRRPTADEPVGLGGEVRRHAELELEHVAEARRRRVGERHPRDVQRRQIGVAERRTRPAEGDHHAAEALLRPGPPGLRAGLGHGDGPAGGAFGPPRHLRRHELRDASVIHRAGHRQDGARGVVVLAPERHQALAIERRHRRRGAEDRPAVRVLPEQPRVQQIAGHRLGVLGVPADLLDHDLLLALELGGVERGVARHVEQHVDRVGGRGGVERGVQAGLVPRGPRVEVAPERLDLARGLADLPALGALEHEVFDEVGGALEARRLVHRPDVEPQVHRDDRALRHGRREQPQPSGQGGELGFGGGGGDLLAGGIGCLHGVSAPTRMDSGQSGAAENTNHPSSSAQYSPCHGHTR